MCLLCDTARKSRQRLAGAPVEAVRAVRPASAPLLSSLPAGVQPAARPALKLISAG